MRGLPRGILTGALLAAALAGRLQPHDDVAPMPIGSSAIDDRVPTRFTCDGDDVSPPIEITIHPDAGTWALIVDDPDAPEGTFTHWLIWDVPANRSELPEDLPRDGTLDPLGGAEQGTNGFGEVGYRGPCPPEGETHTYRFTAYALDGSLDLDPGADRGTVDAAIEGRVLESGRMTAGYGR